MFSKNKKEDLLAEIAALEEENKRLAAAIKRIDNKELFETVKIFTSHYRKCMYRKIPFDWLETVFYTYKDILLKYANGCFIGKLLDTAYSEASARDFTELIMFIPMYCENFFITRQGTSLLLSDPYRKITTSPSQISYEEAMIIKDRIIVAKLVIPENHRTAKAFTLKGYKKLNMTLTSFIDKPKPVNYNTLFTKYKGIENEKDAIMAIDYIEQYYKSHNAILVIRVNEYTLRIVTQEKKIGVWYENNKLWYGEEICRSYSYIKNLNCLFQGSNYLRPLYLFEDEDLCNQ